jgi:hypothetical protein
MVKVSDDIGPLMPLANVTAVVIPELSGLLNVKLAAVNQHSDGTTCLDLG